jgi:hypothetical protein
LRLQKEIICGGGSGTERERDALMLGWICRQLKMFSVFSAAAKNEQKRTLSIAKE